MNNIHSQAQQHFDGISARDIKKQAKDVGKAWGQTMVGATALGTATLGLGAMVAKSAVSGLSKTIMKLLQWTSEFLTKERHLIYIKDEEHDATVGVEGTSKAREQKKGVSLRQKVWETIKSLKDFVFKRSQGKASLSEEISGTKQAQAQKFLKLLHTPTGEQAPPGLEQMKVNVEGIDLIVVDKQGKVITNEIQPLMATATVKAALEDDKVELPNVPAIEPVPGSLADNEIQIQSDVLAASDSLEARLRQREDIANNQIQEELAEVKTEVESEELDDGEILSFDDEEYPDFDNLEFAPISNQTSVEIPLPPAEESADLSIPDSSEEKEPAVESYPLKDSGTNAPGDLERRKQEQEKLEQTRSELDRQAKIGREVVPQLNNNRDFLRALEAIAQQDLGVDLTSIYQPHLSDKFLAVKNNMTGVTLLVQSRATDNGRAFVITNESQEPLIYFTIDNSGVAVDIDVNVTAIENSRVFPLSGLEERVEDLARFLKGENQHWEIVPTPNLEGWQSLDRANTLSVESATDSAEATLDYNRNLKVREQAATLVPIPLNQNSRSDLATIAQLHQIATPTDTNTLVLVNSDLEEVGTLTQQNISPVGDATYQFESKEQQFSFTIDPHGIVTNLKANPQTESNNTRHLISQLARIVWEPENTDLQLATASQIAQVETLQQLTKTLEELDEANDKPIAASVVTIGGQELNVTQDKNNNTIVITDTTTAQSMMFKSGWGIKDGGLLKGMLTYATENGESIAQKFISLAQEQVKIASSALDNAIPNTLVAIEEGVRRDREARANFTANVVETVGAKIDSLVGAVVTNLSPEQTLSGTVGQMKRISQVEEGTSERVEDVFSLLNVDEVEEEKPELTVEQELQANIKSSPKATSAMTQSQGLSM
jgi:hypothetical protein